MSAPAGPPIRPRRRLPNAPSRLGERGRADPVAPLVAAFEQAVTEIRARLESGAGRSDAFLLAQADAIVRTLDGLDAEVAEWARRTIAAQYVAAGQVAQGELVLAFRRAGLPAASGRFTGLDRRAARALIERTSRNLSAVRRALVVGLSLGEPGSGRTVRSIRAALEADNQVAQVAGRGLVVRTPAGMMWDPTAYSRMVARTAVADATRVSHRQRYLQNGADVVRVTDTGTRHEVCRVWEGERLSLTGRTPGLPTTGDARAAGLFHPNCTHRYVVDVGWLAENGRATPVTAVPETPFATLGQAPQRPVLRPSTRRRIEAAVSRN